MLRLLSLAILAIAVCALHLNLHQKKLADEIWDSLTPQTQSQLLNKKSQYGFDLKYMSKATFMHEDSGFGVFAADPSCYSVFQDYIEIYYQMQSECNPYVSRLVSYNFEAGSGNVFESESIKKGEEYLQEYVISSRLRVGRNLADFPFTTAMTKKQRIDAQSVILEAIKKLPEEYKGTYYSFLNLTDGQLQDFNQKHLAFNNQSQQLAPSGMFTDWPYGRGTYIGKDPSFMLWVGEEDQLRVIGLAKGVDFEKLYNRVEKALSILTKDLKIAQQNGLGYLSSSPANTGTIMRASIEVAIPEQQQQEARSLFEGTDIEVRSIPSLQQEGVTLLHLSNHKRICKSVRDLIKYVVTTTSQIIRKHEDLFLPVSAR